MAKVTKILGTTLPEVVRPPYKLLSLPELLELNGIVDSHDGPPPGGLDGFPEMTPTIHISDGRYLRPDKPRIGLYGGEVDDAEAANVRLVSYSGFTGGVYAEGGNTDYTLENAVINLSGDGAGLGGKSAGAAVSNKASLTLKNVNISVSGTDRCATTATDHSVLRVYDSTLVSHGSPYGDDAPENQTDVTPPEALEIKGNCRTHCTLQNSYSYFYNSTIITDGWAALSTDMSDGFVYLEANDCRIIATKSGYGAYADFCCHDVFNGCDIDVACVGAIIGGQADVSFNDCRIKCGTYLGHIHTVMGTIAEVGELNVTDCDAVTRKAAVIIKSHNAIVRLKNSKIVSEAGILVHSAKNDDPSATRVQGQEVYGIHIRLEEMDARGDIIHEDPERRATIYLNTSTLLGAIKNAGLVMDLGSKWIATGDSEVIFGSDVDEAQIDALAGVTITAVGGINREAALPSGGRLIVKKD